RNPVSATGPDQPLVVVGRYVVADQDEKDLLAISRCNVDEFVEVAVVVHWCNEHDIVLIAWITQPRRVDFLQAGYLRQAWKDVQQACFDRNRSIEIRAGIEQVNWHCEDPGSIMSSYRALTDETSSPPSMSTPQSWHERVSALSGSPGQVGSSPAQWPNPQVADGTRKIVS